MTAQGARAYGVVANDSGEVDAAATSALRKGMAGSRGDLKLFDYGPGIDALRANCLAETGLPAPIQPVWAQRAVGE